MVESLNYSLVKMNHECKILHNTGHLFTIHFAVAPYCPHKSARQEWYLPDHVSVIPR
jgi:hypothetical protein